MSGLGVRRVVVDTAEPLQTTFFARSSSRRQTGRGRTRLGKGLAPRARMAGNAAGKRGAGGQPVSRTALSIRPLAVVLVSVSLFVAHRAEALSVTELRRVTGSGASLGTLTEGLLLDPDATPDNFSIEAVVDAAVGSVVFELTGPIGTSRTDDDAPYSLFGDAGTSYETARFPMGTYTVTATPYTGANATGDVGASLSVGFTVGEASTVPEPGMVLLAASALGLALAARRPTASIRSADIVTGRRRSLSTTPFRQLPSTIRLGTRPTPQGLGRSRGTS